MNVFKGRMAPDDAQQKACIAEHVMINAGGRRPVLDDTPSSMRSYAAWCCQYGTALREYADAMQRMGSAYYSKAAAYSAE